MTVGGQHGVNVDFSQYENRTGSLCQGVLSTATSPVVKGKSCIPLEKGAEREGRTTTMLWQDGRRWATAGGAPCTSLTTCSLLNASQGRGPRFIRSSQASSAGGAGWGEAAGFPWSSTRGGGFRIQKDTDAVSRWVPHTARTSALPFRVRQTVIY